jgi:hypothetical protein
MISIRDGEDNEQQWSPSATGGNTCWPGLPYCPAAMPQWSPPVDDGSTEETLNNVNLAWGPQWSPPQIGGSTRELLEPQDGHRLAAMEPVAGRREHQGCGARGRRPGTRRNGPAADRREHLPTSR